MARSSILGASHAPTQAPGRDGAALGPSDGSDSGSDVAMTGDSDSTGTGERASAIPDEDIREAMDITPDRITATPGTDEAADASLSPAATGRSARSVASETDDWEEDADEEE